MERDIKFEKSLGEKIREFREALNWSQDYLASVAGTDKKHIQALEKGSHSPYTKTITGVAKALGRQPWEVYKADYQVKVNTNLQPQPKKIPGATQHIFKLLETSFFNTSREVYEVVKECKTRYSVTLKSSAVSGVLKRLVDHKLLKSSPGKIKGRLVYKKEKNRLA